MPDIVALKNELDVGHPATGPYSLNNSVALAELHAVNRTLNRPTMTASEVYNAIDATEYVALASGPQAEVWDILHLGELNPFGLEATRFIAIFGGSSATITALQAARKRSVSRVAELISQGIQLGDVRLGQVELARAA